MKTFTPILNIRILTLLLMISSRIIFAQVTNTNTALVYPTIQAAIDDPLTINGHTLMVDPGIYTENIVVSKELTILGPKMGIDGNSGSRGTGEAIIYPPSVWYGDGTFNGGYLMRITADNVIVDGFTFDGDNPSLEGVYGTNTGFFDVDFGIMSVWSYWYESTNLTGDNLNIQNNILRNFKISGIMMWAGFDGAAASSSIRHNKIQNVANMAIFLSDNYYADIEFNTILDSKTGIHAYFYYNPDPTGTGGSIKNNSITTGNIQTNWGESYTNVKGVFYHFTYNFADPWAISNNTITNTSLAGDESSGVEITVDATTDPMVISNNTISGFEYGYRLSTNSINGTTISGGSLMNNRYGAAVSNFNFNGNYPADYSDFSLIGVNIQDNLEAGVFIEDHESSLNHEAFLHANVMNCYINGNPKGILVNNTYGSVTAHENDLSDNSQYAIQAIKVKNQSPVVDATCNWYGHWSGPANAYYDGGLGSPVSGQKVTFAPWLVDGTDTEVAPGFQPTPGSCEYNCGNKFYNLLVCHNDKTLCVPVSDAFTHVDHGDPLGSCPEPYSINGPDMTSPVMVTADAFEVYNMPNPFDNSTVLTYTLPMDSKVSLRVYDAMGMEVFSLKNRDTKAGVHTVDFDGSRLNSGVYYLMVMTNTPGMEFVKSVKMIKQ